MSFLKEFVLFLKERKKLWLVPILVMMLVFGFLMIVAEGSALAPFLYSLF